MKTSKVDQERLLLAIDAISPSPENALLYRPVTPDDEATIALANSITANGILEPLVISADGYIISGHRRHCAGRISALKEVPCRILNVRRGDGDRASDEFLKLLREHNRQGVKTRDESLREAVVDVDPDKAHRALTAYRKRKARSKSRQSRFVRQRVEN
jgi:ParB-like nuclease family protein